MDAQGRGHAGDIDPADQWVLNPRTGNYELRLNPAGDPSGGAPESGRAAPPHQRGPAPGESTGRRPAPGGTGAATSGTGAARAGTRSGEGTGTRSGGAGQRLPAQRGRRAGGPQRGGGPVSRRKPKAKPPRRKKVLRIGGGAIALLVLAGCTTASVLYFKLNGNIDKVDVGIRNDATTDGPVNILVIGTDARTGKGNEKYGDLDSVGHADTTLLLHVAKDRSNATVLSIPRDMVTDIPACPTQQPDGSEKVIPGEQGVRFNESLGQHGRDPGCTWRTVEQLTGLKINHFMMADFNAVKTLSTAVGGVEVCVAKDIDDPKSHLKLSAGTHVVEGEQALAFVRTRSSVGLGSDLSRIELQQQFLGSMFRQMKSAETLTSPTKLLDLADAATKALTVDTGIGRATDLAALARDLSRVPPKNITFATVPVLDNPAETVKTTVVLDEAKARPLFEMVKADKSLTETGKKKAGDAKGGAAEPAKAPAAEVRVDVLNGGGPIGAAQQTVSWLQNSQGVSLSRNAGNAEAEQPATTLSYGPDQAGQAATLAELMGLPKSALKEQAADAGPGVPMTLTLGGDFDAAGTPLVAPDKAPEGVQKINGGDDAVCAK
ncbi:LCP family protein [Streptomyces sp. TRM 70351]|uniref:LCP family protein n=1 Tax=Streptomyces sp. TRM 70351 TaxID=3116552 RepID=UPI002E7BDE5A|nr:LCP family protein [Streptomyces sp. TRM 70351]MEE1929327.1 LCP family protein [Streptomyces sp. TRM 70351]